MAITTKVENEHQSIRPMADGPIFLKNKLEKFKQYFSFLKSLRLRLFLTIMILTIIPILFMVCFIVYNAEGDQIRRRTEELQYQCNAISRQMSKLGYLKDVNVSESLNTDMEMLSSIYDGRIMVVNSSFEIIRDTYGLDVGRYHVSEKVIKCYQGTDSQSQGKGYLEFTVPVYDYAMRNVEGVMIASMSTRGIGDAVAIQGRNLRIMVVISSLVCFVLAFIASGILLRPFRKLNDGINKASFGDMSPITVSDTLETERIASTYNETLLRLKNMDESRQEFVSNVSHELKTPITSIRVLADSLLAMGDGATVELYQEFLKDISDEIDRESSIIEDLLTLVRLDRTNAELKVQVVNINDLLELLLKRLRPIARRRNIEVVFESYRPVMADIDEVKLTLALSNLVENAIKYNHDNGWVKVTLNADHNYFYVKVEDSGVGIPEDAVPKVFERFYRVDKARSRDTGGTGLGLAITQSIVQLHHGTVKVHSELGNGTVFHVRIPLTYIA